MLPCRREKSAHAAATLSAFFLGGGNPLKTNCGQLQISSLTTTLSPLLLHHRPYRAPPALPPGVHAPMAGDVQLRRRRPKRQGKIPEQDRGVLQRVLGFPPFLPSKTNKQKSIESAHSGGRVNEPRLCPLSSCYILLSLLLAATGFASIGRRV